MNPDFSPTPRITGNTDVYLIAGDPVMQVRAPEAFNLVFSRLGIDAVMVPVHVLPSELKAFTRSAFAVGNVGGLLLTIPHKVPVLEMLDECDPLGQLAGAVNGIRRHRASGRLQGGLFDGEGLLAALDFHGMEFRRRSVLIIGAGGAAAAIVASLVSAGPASASDIACFDPAAGRAGELAQRMAAAGHAQVRAVASSDPRGFDLVINASPLGLQFGDPLPCDVTRMASHAALIDIIMKNQPTPVVRAARARGLNAQPGFEMMIQQIPLYLDFFGLNGAAQQLRQDADFLRRPIYPPEMHDELVARRTPRPTGADLPA